MALDVIWTAEFAEAGWIKPWEGERRSAAEEGKLEGPLETVALPGPDLGDPVHQQHPAALVSQGPGRPPAGRLHLGRDDRPGGRERHGHRGAGRAVRGPGRLDQRADRGRRRPDRRTRTARRRWTRAPSGRPRSRASSRLAGAAAGPVDQPRGRGAHRLRVGPLRLPDQLHVHLPERRGDRGLPGEDRLGPLPAHREGASRASPPLGGFNLAVSEFSNNPDLAFEAAECLANEDHQALAAELGGLPPTTESVYEEEKVTKAFPFADLLRESIDNAAPRPVTPAYSDISLAIQKTFHPPDGVEPDRHRGEAARPDRQGRSRGRSSDGGRHDLRADRPAAQEEAHDRPREGRAQARLDAVRAGGDRDAGRDRLSDRLRVLPVAAEVRPALPRRQGVRRPVELRRRAHLEHLVVGRRSPR